MARSFLKVDLQTCLASINTIPISELKYYLLLTYHSLKNADAEKYQEFLDELIVFSQKLTEFLNPNTDTLDPRLLEEIQLSYKRLCDFSKTNTVSIKIGYALIDIGSVLLAVFTGILGGLIGGGAGLVRSLLTFSNPLRHLADGLITGLSFGAAIGFRAPKKIFKDELSRQLKFCLNSIDSNMQEVQAQIVKPLPHYRKQVEERLLTDCFSGDSEAYEAFLRGNHDYQIVALSARFVSPNLEGYLGQHACIAFSLPNQSEPELIEFSLGKSDVKNRVPTETDERTVTGEKLVEMMALHQQLQVTQTCTYGYALTKMKAGENDCYRYVEKILVGTGQETTTVKRFNGAENWVGKNIVGFFVKKLSPFSQDVLQTSLAVPSTLE
ncbi:MULTISPECIES: hypothetical protein [Legionella]|uniref:Uncharacterized protein n=1 Tax=Legionella drozanskii LLAP-1 TaxID=1212489 RepID=A0A0W0SPM0_9GAMM|nr:MULTISPECIES: hypothetical protein [Legionella]KTC85346.1 hypothetical protein Ldro_2518 [Legionella drozanskii LLAP-1]PJE10100.1 MAG: hypothetical protein CK430_10485 [Legionella sp.]